MTAVLGIDPTALEWGASTGPEVAALGRLVEVLIEQRAQARATKNFAAADGVRDALTAAGIRLEDAAGATHWSVD